jgi:hypothetical protein
MYRLGTDLIDDIQNVFQWNRESYPFQHPWPRFADGTPAGNPSVVDGDDGSPGRSEGQGRRVRLRLIEAAV